jgi:hypothetical protein
MYQPLPFSAGSGGWICRIKADEYTKSLGLMYFDFDFFYSCASVTRMI